MSGIWPIFDALTLRMRLAEYGSAKAAGRNPAELEKLRRHIVRRAWALVPDDRRVLEMIPADWLDDEHPFQQVTNVFNRVCGCGKWPDHHIHTGDRAACTCDACRAPAQRGGEEENHGN